MQIRTVSEHALAVNQDAEIAALLCAAFGADDGYEGRSFYRQRHHLRFLGYEDDTLVSHLALTFREVRLGARLLPIFGVGEVATHPGHRGRGHASQLMKASISRAEASLAEFMILLGDRPIYEGHGFRTIPNKTRYLEIETMTSSSLADREFQCLMTLPVGPASWDDTAPLDLLGPLF